MSNNIVNVFGSLPLVVFLSQRSGHKNTTNPSSSSVTPIQETLRTCCYEKIDPVLTGAPWAALCLPHKTNEYQLLGQKQQL